MSKVPLVLFSGGLDSTYLVSTLLQSGPVDVIYVNGGQCKDKIKCEIEARDKLIEKFNTYYPYKIQGQYEIIDPVYLHTGSDKKWTQPNAWIQGVYRVLHAARHKAVYIGYVKDDGFAFGGAMRSLKKLWKNLLKVSFTGKHVSLKFPLKHLSKVEILENLDKRLLDDVWVCELPVDGKHCKKCKPCKLMELVLYDYKCRNGKSVWLTATQMKRKYLNDRENKQLVRANYKPLSSAYKLFDSGVYEDYSGKD